MAHRYIDEKALRDWTLNGTSSANSAQTLTKSAEAGKRHVITSYLVAARGGTPAETLTITIKKGTTVIWTDAIRDGTSRASHTFPGGLIGDVGGTVSIEVAAGGASVITEANLEGGSTA